MNQTLIHQKAITQDIFHMTFNAPEIAREAQPGQFVHMRITEGIDPLLRRPLSIHRVHRQKGTLEILYRVVGRGTALMSKAESGDSFDLMGPLGKGFRIDDSFTHALVVAGGMGSAPVFFLIDELVEYGKQVTFFWGAKTGQEIFGVDALKQAGVEVHTATEDGTLGVCGLVTDPLSQFLSSPDTQTSYEGFVCGPKPMLKCIQEIIVDTSITWQASLEEKMACGMGVCIGCAVQTQTGYQMVCSDGPVMDLKEIVFDG